MPFAPAPAFPNESSEPLPLTYPPPARKDGNETPAFSSSAVGENIALPFVVAPAPSVALPNNSFDNPSERIPYVTFSLPTFSLPLLLANWNPPFLPLDDGIGIEKGGIENDCESDGDTEADGLTDGDSEADNEGESDGDNDADSEALIENEGEGGFDGDMLADNDGDAYGLTDVLNEGEAISGLMEKDVEPERNLKIWDGVPDIEGAGLSPSPGEPYISVTGEVITFIGFGETSNPFTFVVVAYSPFVVVAYSPAVVGVIPANVVPPLPINVPTGDVTVPNVPANTAEGAVVAISVAPPAPSGIAIFPNVLIYSAMPFPTLPLADNPSRVIG